MVIESLICSKSDAGERPSTIIVIAHDTAQGGAGRPLRIFTQDTVSKDVRTWKTASRVMFPSSMMSSGPVVPRALPLQGTPIVVVLMGVPSSMSSKAI